MESQQNPVPPATTTPPAATPPMKAPMTSTFIFIMVGIGALLLMGLTGFHFGRQYSNPLPLVPAPTSNPDIQPTAPVEGVMCTMEALECPDGSFVGRQGPKCEFTPCSTGDKITPEWKTYKDPKDTYTFQYPETASLDSREEGIMSISYSGPTQRKQTELYDGYSINFYPSSMLDNSQTLKQIVENDIQESNANGTGEITKGLENLTINNLQGFTYSARGLGEYKYIYLQSPNSNIYIQLTTYLGDTTVPDAAVYKKTVDKILSTFKFTK